MTLVDFRDRMAIGIAALVIDNEADDVGGTGPVGIGGRQPSAA